MKDMEQRENERLMSKTKKKKREQLQSGINIMKNGQMEIEGLCGERVRGKQRVDESSIAVD